MTDKPSQTPPAADENALIAERLGARDVPRSCQQVEAYLQRMRPQLHCDARSHEVIQILLDAPAPSRLAKPVARKTDDFVYVATLGYFTPRSLPGAQVPDAAAVAQLLQRGGGDLVAPLARSQPAAVRRKQP